ncbi:putative transcription factor C3H family [Lupinus albus]|uniref:Putative transcription factor C3H family n=1 Tax=Lupinus albus TaxID=3870 RepID=A0A6A4PDW1_LUPAL|nr:putative transcription factor C3H family [Lupinus albus]
MEEMKSLNDSTQFSVIKSLQDDFTSDNAVLEDEKKIISKLESENVLKVDEFGRYLREAPADSDSDNSRRCQTDRLNRRDRSRSHSRSPPHRRSRRRRRSPHGIRGRISRSRSQSPRRRRSRSKSPIIRRLGEFGGVSVKRDKSHCFDFSRGRCYRGASCRYIHHESNRNATSRRFKNKYDLEVDSHENNSGVNEGLKNISSNISDYEHDGVRSQDEDLCQNVTGQEVEHRKEDSVRHAVVCTTSGLDSQLVNNDLNNFERFRKAAPEVQETLVLREEHKTLGHNNDSSQNAVNSHQPHISMSYVSDSSFDKKSMIFATANMVSITEPVPYVLPHQLSNGQPLVRLVYVSHRNSLHYTLRHIKIYVHIAAPQWKYHFKLTSCLLLLLLLFHILRVKKM